ncbi:uncharacterized protein LOC124145011 [Haliotis rufescens]|uniref:uncharacterized protein LOC124145011 n=1 Tax=Haliotis rufescens TaxID=6454 RepID=UPI00201EE55B|nr:uncharacterized protein LOC124145011 [Haliotis rufescens]
MRTSGSRLEDIYTSCQVSRYRLLFILLTVLGIFLIITVINESTSTATFHDEDVSNSYDPSWSERSKGNWSVLGTGMVMRRQMKTWNVLDSLCATNDTLIPVNVSTPAGNVVMYVHDEDDEVAYEQKDKQILTPVLKLMWKNKDMSFIDIGANTGLCSLVVAALGNPVVAIEPFRDNIPRFCQGILDSDLVGRCYIVTNALWDSNRMVKVTPALGKFNHNYKVLPYPNRKGDTTNTILLSELLDQFPMTKTGIQIGSHDNVTRVLAGGVKLFDVVDVVFVHVNWHYVLQKQQDKFVLNFLKSRGYRSYGYWRDFTLLDDQPDTWPQYVFFMKDGEDSPSGKKQKYVGKKDKGHYANNDEDDDGDYDGKDDNNDYDEYKEYDDYEDYVDYDDYEDYMDYEGSGLEEGSIWSRMIQSKVGSVVADSRIDYDDLEDYNDDDDDDDDDVEEEDATWWRYTDTDVRDGGHGPLTRRR